MDLLNEFKKFLFSQTNPPSKVTVKNYLSDINHFVRWFENKSQTAFDPEAINKLIIENYKTENSGNLSAASLERHLSSLRKFFYFLVVEAKIQNDPFKPLALKHEDDPWHLKDFKSFLYVYNASHLTIKNYLIDIKQFLNWAEEVTGNLSEAGSSVLGSINSELLEEYKNRLLSNNQFSASSINRKLSSLRKYISWALEENLIPNFDVKVANLSQEKQQAQFLEEKEFSQLPVLEAKLPIGYSKFPPLRLLQKVTKGIDLALEASLIAGIAKIIEGSTAAAWKIKGQPIFNAARKIRLARYIDKADIFGVRNIKKEIYAPLELSTANMPLYKKLWIKARYQRPKWYKTYHTYAFAHYLNLVVLMIFIAGLSIGFYNGFVKSKSPTLAANPNLPTNPQRILSFQGRLTDNTSNPITSATNLRFAIYRSDTGTGAATLLWQEVDQVAPDQDGIFNVLLGNTSTVCANPNGTVLGKCSIYSTLFSENNALWLGVTVESTGELTPRQPIATVAYAVNSETLQGLLPITATAAAVTNVVLALDSTGNLTIGSGATTANPVFSANGNFTISTGTSNGNILLSSDADSGVQIGSALSATPIAPLFVNGGIANNAALIVNNKNSGNIIAASSGGTTKFVIDSSGNISVSNYTTIGQVLYGSSAVGAVSQTSGGSTGNCLTFNSGSAPTWGPCGAGNGVNWWDQVGGLVYPDNSGWDFAVGGNSTASADFSITNLFNGSNVIASLAGRLTVANPLNVVSQTPIATISGNTPTVLLHLNNNGIGDLLTASNGGNTKFTLDRNGFIALGGRRIVPGNTSDITLQNGDTIANTAAGTTALSSTTFNLGAGSAATITTTTNGLTLDSGSNTLTFAASDTTLTTSLTTFTTGTTLAMTSTATLNLGNNATLSSNATALNLEEDGGVDINIGGTSAGTGCTVTNSNGNLACAGTISAGGTVLSQYWQRITGNLSPLTLNDTIAATSSAFTVATHTSNNPTGTLTNNTLIQQTGAGTVTNLLTLSRTAGTVTTGLNLTGTIGTDISLQNGETITNSPDNTINLSFGAAGGTLLLTSATSANLNSSTTLNINTGNAIATSIGNASSTLTLTGSNVATGQVAYGSSNAVNFTSGGSTGNCLTFNSGSAPTWNACSGVNWWNQVGGLIFPVQNAYDFAVGGNSTASATFAVINNITSFPIATVAGQFMVGSDLRKVVQSPIATISGNTPTVLLSLNNNGIGDLFTASNGGNTKFTIDRNGFIGLGGRRIVPGNTSDITLQNGDTIANTAAGTIAINSSTLTATSLGTFTTANTISMNPQSGTTYSLNTTGTTLNLFQTPSTINLGPSGGSLVLGNGGAYTITTGTNQNLSVNPNGSGILNLNTAGTGATNLGTSTNTGNVSIGNSTGSLTLTSSGITANTNSVLYSGASNVVNTVTTSTAGMCLISGTNSPGWTNCAAGANDWIQTGGLLYPVQNAWDLAIGGNSTASAHFAVINNITSFPIATVAGRFMVGSDLRQVSQTPIATISGNTPTVLLSLNNNGIGDLLTASNGGNTKFTIDRNGFIGIGTRILPGNTSDITLQNGETIDNVTNGTINLNTTILGLTNTTTLTASSLTTLTSSSTLGISATTLNVGNGAQATIATTGNQILNISAGTNTLNLNTAAGGAITLGGNTTVSTTKTLTLTDISGNNQLLYGAPTTGVVTGVVATSTPSQCLLSGATIPAWGSCPSTGAVNWWNQVGGLVYPTDSGWDFAVGGNSTASAKFSISNIFNNSFVIASLAGRLTVAADLRTNSPTPIATISGRTDTVVLSVNNNGGGDLFTASRGGNAKFVIKGSGLVGIGTTLGTLATGLQIQPIGNIAQTQDLVSLANNVEGATGQDPTTAGVNALQLSWSVKPPTGGIISAERINVNNTNSSTGGQAQGIRIVATGPGTTINSSTVGLYIDGLLSATTGTTTQNAIQIGANWDSSIYGDGDLRINAAGNIILATSSATTKVGIGTNAPTARLDIVGSASLSGSLGFNGAGTNLVSLLNNNNLNFAISPSGVPAVVGTGNAIEGNATTFTTTGQSQLSTGIASAGAMLNAKVNGINFLYTLGGSTSATAQTSNVQISQVAQNGNVGTWTAPVTLAKALSQHATALVNNLYVYTIGGTNAGTNLTDVEFGVLGTNGAPSANLTTTGMTALPLARFGLGAFSFTDTSGRSYIYAVGGKNGGNTAVLNSIIKSQITLTTGANGAWAATTATLSTGVRHFGITNPIYIKGVPYVYVIGGNTGACSTTAPYTCTDTMSNVVQKLTINPVNGDVSAVAATTVLPTALQQASAQVISIGGLNYVFVEGGDTAAGGTPQTTVYQATLDDSGNVISWTSTNQTALTNGITGSSATALFAGRDGIPYIYMAGGNGGFVTRVVRSQITTSNSALYASNTGAIGFGTINPNNFDLQIAGNIGPELDNIWSLGASPSATASNSGRFANAFLGQQGLHVICLITDGCGQTLDYSVFVNTTTGSLSIDANNAPGAIPLLTLTQGGNLGIGVNSPSFPLDVLGDINLTGAVRISGSAGSSGQCLTSTGTISSWASCGGVNWWNQVGGLVYPTSSLYDFAVGGSATTSALFSYTGIQSATHQTIASISGKLIVMPNNGYGNVGIGIANPAGLLDIYNGGTEALLLTSAGLLQAQSFYDIGNTTYFLDPASAGDALRVLGNVAFGTFNAAASSNKLFVRESKANALAVFDQTGAGDIIAASSAGSIAFRVANNGDVTVGNAGAGKVTAGTYDPLYTINGQKYATYLPGMPGVKEEVTGKVTLSYNAVKKAYAYSIPLANQPEGSDIWLFANVTTPDINLISVILTPENPTRVWYQKDPATRTLTILADAPTTVSFRLTAPRFDYLNWGNISHGDGSATGHIIAQSNLILPVDPNATQSGLGSLPQFEIVENSSSSGQSIFKLADSFGNIVDLAQSFSDILAANIKAGLIEARKITLNGVDIKDYIASVVTDILGNGNYISPISTPNFSTDLITSTATSSAIAIKLDTDKISILNGKTASDTAVTTFDREGNATFSGSIRAKKIIADEIEGLHVTASTVSANYITNITNINNYFPTIPATASSQNQTNVFAGLFTNNQFINIATFSSQLAYIDNLNAANATFSNGLMVYGPTSLSDTSIVGQLSINGTMIFTNNSIDTLGSDLNLQPLRQGGLSIMAGLIYIDTNGDMKLGSDLTVNGKLYASNIYANGGDLSLNLSSDSASLNIKSATGSSLLSVNTRGDLIASGGGTFGKLNIGNLVGTALAVSQTEIIATGSAGTATINTNQTEITIDNKMVTSKSLIYITPTTLTTQPLFLLRQVPNTSFTVGMEKKDNVPIKFNWIIIN